MVTKSVIVSEHVDITVPGHGINTVQRQLVSFLILFYMDKFSSISSQAKAVVEAGPKERNRKKQEELR